MKRRLFNALRALSLLLCVATATLWVRSYWVGDSFFLIHRSGRTDLLRCGSGQLSIETSRRDELSPTHPPLRFFHERGDYLGFSDPTISYPTNPNQHAWKFGPFSFVRVFYRPGWMWRLNFPAWLIVAPFLVLPARWVHLLRIRRRAHRAGLCPICGYDLRATPDRCPECGMVTARA